VNIEYYEYIESTICHYQTLHPLPSTTRTRFLLHTHDTPVTPHSPPHTHSSPYARLSQCHSLLKKQKQNTSIMVEPAAAGGDLAKRLIERYLVWGVGCREWGVGCVEWGEGF